MMETRPLKYESKFKDGKVKVKKIMVSIEFQFIIFQLNTELELNNYRLIGLNYKTERKCYKAQISKNNVVINKNRERTGR